MDIECKQGRHFVSIEAIKQCPIYPCSKCTSEPTKIDPIKKNKQCPVCLKYSIFTFGISEYCSDPDCPDYMVYKISIRHNTTEPIIIDSEFHNPSLLSVKMFLADIMTWRNRYREDEYVCIDFSKEVVQKATEVGMRCGLVYISFERNDVGHAIVAFETDHGLIFIEPQNGEHVDVRLSRTYYTGARGFQESNIVKSVKIVWNDGTNSELK